ncbi:hypothetical protein CU026_1799 [Enterococcus faecium]|nr:hypothetical protein [Enterococcus faecium]MBK4814993.1 hypothetical protein [Enterococcus faecium]
MLRAPSYLFLFIMSFMRFYVNNFRFNILKRHKQAKTKYFYAVLC